MHAGLVTEPRYGLVERARNTFLKGVQHVIVHGGSGGGTLTVPANEDELTLAEAWNGTWGRGTTRRRRRRRLNGDYFYDDNGGEAAARPVATATLVNVVPDGWDGNISESGGADDKQRRRQLITVSYPDPPGCTFLIRTSGAPPLVHPLCPQTALKVPSFVQIGKYAGAQKTVVSFTEVCGDVGFRFVIPVSPPPVMMNNVPHSPSACNTNLFP
jgi:hypothetical protein